jgi:tRNA(Ile)-lysidine synthase
VEFVRQLQQPVSPVHSNLTGSGYSLRQHDDAIHAVAVLDSVPTASAALQPGVELELGESRLSAVEVASGGVRSPADGHWQVQRRQGGERCRPLGQAHSQSLKKLLQAWRVPPWWRDRLPLLYEGDKLVAVADLWVCEGYAAEPGQAGWKVIWRRDSLSLAD